MIKRWRKVVACPKCGTGMLNVEFFECPETYDSPAEEGVDIVTQFCDCDIDDGTMEFYTHCAEYGYEYKAREYGNF